jgi:hypothetical protein
MDAFCGVGDESALGGWDEGSLDNPAPVGPEPVDCCRQRSTGLDNPRFGEQGRSRNESTGLSGNRTGHSPAFDHAFILSEGNSGLSAWSYLSVEGRFSTLDLSPRGDISSKITTVSIRR